MHFLWKSAENVLRETLKRESRKLVLKRKTLSSDKNRTGGVEVIGTKKHDKKINGRMDFA